MRYLLAAAIAIAINAPAFAGPAKAAKPVDVKARARAASVWTEAVDGSTGCSGTIISPNGFLITAKHCGGHAEINVVLANGRLVKAKLVYVGPYAEDILGYMLPSGHTYDFAPLSTAAPQQNDPVFSFGYPASRTTSFVRDLGYAEGLVRNGPIFNSCRMNMVSFATAPGWSGGGLFSAKGELIGSLSAGNSKISLYIPWRNIVIANAALKAVYEADKNTPFQPPLHPTRYIKESALLPGKTE